MMEKNKMKTSKHDFVISSEYEGARLDTALSLLMEEHSRSYIQKLIEESNVEVIGHSEVSKNLKLKAGEIVTVTITEPEEIAIEKENISIDIVYEDESLLIVNKCKGMVVHPAPGNMSGTLVNAIMYHCGNSLSTINGVIRPGIVHRIDKDTSGLLIVAKNDNAHRSLAKQLEEHTVNRKYVALVYNNIKNEEGTIDEPIGSDTKVWHKKIVRETNSKRAVTHYNVLERFGKYTLIEAKLETGRTHQIRVHMAYIKHPLVGDALYGPSKNPFNVNGQILHAYLIGFIHPESGKYMEFISNPPSEFQNVVNKLGGDVNSYIKNIDE